MQDSESEVEWIAIEPPHFSRNRNSSAHMNREYCCCFWCLADQVFITALYSPHPPSFDQSQYDIVLRRQRARQEGKLKFTAVPSRFLNLTNDFEFAGWGSISRLKFTPEDICQGELTLSNFRMQQVLGQFTASAIAANDMLGSVFYTLPSVIAVAGVQYVNFSVISFRCG